MQDGGGIMGVVKCSACGGMVSEMAAACPHCGQPMAKRCPKCGSKNIAPISGLKKGASAYMFGIFAANTIKIDPVINIILFFTSWSVILGFSTIFLVVLTSKLLLVCGILYC